MPTISDFGAAVRGLPLLPPVHLSDSLASIEGLLVDAKESLESDRESAYLCLVRAIAILRRAGDFPASEGTGQGSLARWQVQRLTTYIDGHLQAPIRTGQLAALLKLSVSHFSHAFKQTTGITPLAYVARRRIKAARAMMLATDEPLTRIAHLHGFCDQSHFTRTFRRETGIAPQAWRRNLSLHDAMDR